ncbi:MAG: hypothetical protein Q7V20_21145 [Aquabacterium sp.]|uniref:hypothetical protein n=1 Tax=Aquabacterium sp. TaxID=1872578 RepID=UPI002715D233|nr:hypothetical protein [Aquabacterium sp.]MDO9005960.1 hypothetical protein [Aquabacterium sp.]
MSLIPRLLTCLLATVVIARVAIAFVVGSTLVTALAWAALLGVSVDVSGAHLLAALLWASLVLGVGIYILRSAKVKRFYAQAK